MKVNVLGTEYEIVLTKEKNEVIDGYVHYPSKKIYIMDLNHHGEFVEIVKERVIRHEIIHAFLFESGLDANSEWADNEEMVDWIALQFPKMAKVFGHLEKEPVDYVDKKDESMKLDNAATVK